MAPKGSGERSAAGIIPAGTRWLSGTGDQPAPCPPSSTRAQPQHGHGTVRGAGPAAHPAAAVPHGACVPPHRSLPTWHICASQFLASAMLERQLADGRGCRATLPRPRPCAMQPGDEGHVGRIWPEPAWGYQEVMEPNKPVATATASWCGEHPAPCTHWWVQTHRLACSRGLGCSSEVVKKMGTSW